MLLGVTIDGASALTRSALAQYYEPYLARPTGITDLARIGRMPSVCSREISMCFASRSAFLLLAAKEQRTYKEAL